MEIIGFLLLIALVPAIIASSKGHGFIGWYIYGVLLWIVAVVHALVLQPTTVELERRMMVGGDARKCPSCAEFIKKDALVCRYCGRDVQPI